MTGARPIPDARLVRAVQVAIAASIFAVASGSSSVRWIIEHARGGVRWGMLFVLCGLALAWAWRRRPHAARGVVLGAGATFAGLALLSAAWSVAPRVTFERAVTIAVLFTAAAALALAADADAALAAAVLHAVLAGVVAVALASFVTLVFTHSNAVQPATLAYGARFEGYSQNPNTLGMLLALGMPLTAWTAFAATTRRGLVLALGICALLAVELAATGSRGSLAAAFIGVLVVVGFAPRASRARLVLAAGVAVAFVVAVGASRIAQPATQPPRPTATRLPRDAELTHPIEAEIGAPAAGGVQRRGLFSSSGRFAAWRGAIRQGNERPVAGYGFGTESRVFVDRYYGLDSDVTENSYVGLYLQLGLAGVLVFVVLLLRVVLPGVRAARRVFAAAASLGVVVAGLVLGVSQSYVYSVGATGTIPFWICAFLTSALAAKTA